MSQTLSIFSRHKKKFIILIALLLLGIALTAVYFLNKPVNDTNSKKEAEIEAGLPQYKTITSKEALSGIADKALEWASDAKVINCTASPSTYFSNEKTYFLGYEKGQFSFWTCMVYSATKKADISIEWRNEVVTVKNVITSYENSPDTSSDPGARQFFDIKKFISSEDLYPKIVEQGYNPDTEYISFSLGFSRGNTKYNTKPIWEIHVYGLTEKEDPTSTYSNGKFLRVLYFDGITGEFLLKESV